jgi:hypothetical protein
MDITPPRMNISQPRMNITPPRMDISQRRMNITPGRMNTMPDYQVPEVVTPRRPDRARSAQGGIRPSSPDRLVPPRSGDDRGSRGDGRGSSGERGREGGGDGRGADRGDWDRGGRDDSRDVADRLREQRDRNARGGERPVGGRDGGRDGGRGDSRGDWNDRHDNDRSRDWDRDRHDRDRHHWNDWDRRDYHRGYIVSRPRDYYIIDRPVYYYTGSGLSIRGGYLGDRFSVSARLSSGVYGLGGFHTGVYYPSATWLTCDRGYVGGYWNGYYWSSYEWPHRYPSTYWVQRGQHTDLTYAVPASQAPVVDGDVRMDAMQLPTAQAPSMQMPVPVDDSGAMTSQSLAAVEYTPLDLGIEAMMLGDAARGADELRVHLREHRDDGRALRLLAVALAETGQPVDAAAVMRMAHEMDPALATETVGLAALGYDEARLRDMVDRSVVHAHRVKSQRSTEAASAWLVVGVLMREQGRDDLAREMIKRARAAGLREDVVESLELAWR